MQSTQVLVRHRSSAGLAAAPWQDREQWGPRLAAACGHREPGAVGRDGRAEVRSLAGRQPQRAPCAGSKPTV